MKYSDAFFLAPDFRFLRYRLCKIVSNRRSAPIQIATNPVRCPSVKRCPVSCSKLSSSICACAWLSATEEATLAIPAAIPAGAKAAPAATGIPTLPILAMISPIVAQPSVSGKELFAMRASSMSFFPSFPHRAVSESCLFISFGEIFSFLNRRYSSSPFNSRRGRSEVLCSVSFCKESSLFCSWDSVLL